MMRAVTTIGLLTVGLVSMYAQNKEFINQRELAVFEEEAKRLVQQQIVYGNDTITIPSIDAACLSEELFFAYNQRVMELGMDTKFAYPEKVVESKNISFSNARMSTRAVEEKDYLWSVKLPLNLYSSMQQHKTSNHQFVEWTQRNQGLKDRLENRLTGNTLETFFQTNKYIPTSIDTAAILDVTQDLYDCGVRTFTIDAYTDFIGSVVDNNALSMRRARAVEGVIKKAHPDVTIVKVARGELEPSGKGNAYDRRAEIKPSEGFFQDAFSNPSHDLYVLDVSGTSKSTTIDGIPVIDYLRQAQYPENAQGLCFAQCSYNSKRKTGDLKTEVAEGSTPFYRVILDVLQYWKIAQKTGIDFEYKGVNWLGVERIIFAGDGVDNGSDVGIVDILNEVELLKSEGFTPPRISMAFYGNGFDKDALEIVAQTKGNMYCTTTNGHSMSTR